MCVCVVALSDCSGLWVRPVFAGDETMKDRKEETRETQTNLNLKQILNHSQCEPKQKLSHTPTDTWTNHSSAAESGLDKGGASGRLYCTDAEKAPPTRDEAPPGRTRVSSLNEDRQSELQYYVSKVQHTHTHTRLYTHTLTHSHTLPVCGVSCWNVPPVTPWTSQSESSGALNQLTSCVT